jgi:FeS assembly SUF system regulator
MIRMTRLTDYGIVLLTYIARDPELLTRNAPDLASKAHLPLPTVSKILKVLARKGLLVAHRGMKGGFSLARRPEEISVAEIISALEGPIAITECSTHAPGKCQLEQLCPVGSNWQKINQAVLRALENITLSEMTHPLPQRLPSVGALSNATIGARRDRVDSRREL